MLCRVALWIFFFTLCGSLIPFARANTQWAGLEIATNMVANATNFFSLATKIVV